MAGPSPDHHARGRPRSAARCGAQSGRRRNACRLPRAAAPAPDGLRRHAGQGRGGHSPAARPGGQRDDRHERVDPAGRGARARSQRSRGASARISMSVWRHRCLRHSTQRGTSTGAFSSPDRSSCSATCSTSSASARRLRRTAGLRRRDTLGFSQRRVDVQSLLHLRALDRSLGERAIRRRTAGTGHRQRV